MSGIDSARACRAELDVVQRNVLSCHEIIKVGVESGANNKFKGVNTSYRELERGRELSSLCRSTHVGCH